MHRKHLFSRINVVLVLAILVLLNAVSGNSYLRLDLTRDNAYSLSRISSETLALLEDPLRVRVLYTAEVPAPYNGVRQYLLDMLREFDAAEDEFFSFEIIDPSTPEGRLEAQQYGLQQVEIQEIRSDEFQARAIYTGAVVLYGNVVERVDLLDRTDGLEYRLTTAIRSAVTQVDALSGTSEEVSLEVLASPGLQELGIQGFAELETQMIAIHDRINGDNYDRIEFAYLEPATADEIDALSREYDLQPLRWTGRDGEERRGLFEVVLRYRDRIERIPIQIFTGLFGGYSLDDPANIEESIRQGLRSLVAANPRVAYSIGNGEKLPDDFQRGAGPFAQLVEERYELVSVDLTEEAVPAGIDTLIINGPSGLYDEVALYRIDQFVMNGGSLFVLLDRHVQQIPTQQEMFAGAQPTWEPIETGLEALLSHWGAEVTDRIVLDEESFVSRQGNQQQQLFQVPIIGGEGVNLDSVVTSGLEDVVVLNAAEILPTRRPNDGADGDEAALENADESAETTYTALLRTSPASWTVDSPSAAGPWLQGAPPSADTVRRDVAVLLDGAFASYFDGPVEIGLPSLGEDEGQEPDALGELMSDDIDVFTDRHRVSSIGEGRVIVVSAAALTTPQMLDAQNRTPNGTFLMNAVDYLNGAPGFAELRSKGIGVPRLNIVAPAVRIAARWINTILVPVLVVVMGGVVWARRRVRSRRIRAIFDTKSEV